MSATGSGTDGGTRGTGGDVGGGAQATGLARDVVAALVEAGVVDAVLSPGSRNAPLAFALHDAAVAGLLRLHTRIDERSAAFTALGASRSSGRPVAVVCTSGTAVANLHPAVLEARHSGVRLVAVTADRPLRLRGTSANQTTEHVGLLVGAPVLDLAGGAGEAERLRDLLREASRGRPGPVHLNVQLDEPLLPTDRWVPDVTVPPAPIEHPWRDLAAEAVEVPLGPRTVVVAGDDAGPPARVLAQDAGWPLLAEPSSGSRTGTHALRAYRLLLDTELGEQVERVVVHGHPTLSRPVTRLLARADVEVWDVDPHALWQRRPFVVARAARALRVAGADEANAGWLAAWREADASVSAQLDRLLAGEPGLTPHEVAGAVARALPPGGQLWVGASSPVRDLDLMVPRWEVGARRKVLANRGLAGIDGVVSSAIGAALARGPGSRNLALLGDVTFLHDGGGLVLGPEESRPDLTLVVVNDDGGSIFSMLEQGAEEYADRFERLFGTPHGVDLAAWCAATRTPHWRVESLPELEHALAQPAGGIEVVEARVRRDDRRALDQRIRALRPA
ncbi:2-succinyl-5-enolpyruvyl-6-hydroxy-3-cyclohexene-1-carboxylic-acid synthase [Nocardioides solisilvae]|uniref:2-succinyl-5-enolpyruvyl-6-hydroxy-3- cyclohexene-1-carboxylic-acid synthase n=1 Tax=Nocardioides solisilvae TaxID=1542435 RepID=UPI001EF6146C|nr:2-succinyl-5-enolpyruvyl-6-hydroxy-3-cyclohexene-1-carboxylic-acid synthase [Nocardioides solisilvae]